MEYNEIDIAEALRRYLVENGLDNNFPIHIFELPLDKENCMGIIFAPSPAPHKTVRVYRQTLEIWLRSSSAKVGKERITKVFNLLHDNTNYTISDFFVHYSYAESMIEDMGRDENRNILFKASFDFLYKRVNNNQTLPIIAS